MAKLPSYIVDDIENGRTSLLNSPFITSKNVIKHYLADYYTRVCEEFSDDITLVPVEKVLNKLSTLITGTIKKEETIKAPLEQLCYNVLVGIFDIPKDTISLSFSLSDNISDTTHNLIVEPGNNDEFIEYDSVNDFEEEEFLFHKRRLINILVMGAAHYLYELAFKEALVEVFNLNAELPQVYKKIMLMNDYVLFKTKIKEDNLSDSQFGCNEVKLGGNDFITSVSAKGKIFPILLFESIKGILETCASYSLPDNFAVATRIMQKADKFSFEQYDLKIGPALWERIMDYIPKFDISVIPYFLRTISEMDNTDFTLFAREFLGGTRKAKNFINQIYDHSVEDKEYSSFESDLLDKQDDKYVLEDFVH